jgi:endonuclease G
VRNRRAAFIWVVAALWPLTFAQASALEDQPQHVAAAERLVRRGTPRDAAVRAARHVMLGLPSPATRDDPRDYLMVRDGSVISYNRDRNGMNWASWQVRKSDLGTVDRTSAWRPDPDLPRGWYQPTSRDYKMDGEGSRGHMVRSGERTSTVEANKMTFVFSNILPQAINNNKGPWNHLEDYYRDAVELDGKEAYVMAGGLFEGPRVGKVAVPTATWKVVALLRPGQSVDDLDEHTRVIAVIIPNNNRDVKERDSFAGYRVSVAEIERRTGLHFFSALPDLLAAALKRKVDDAAVPASVSHEHLHQHRQALPVLAAGVQGRVKWFDPEKGLGFITRTDGTDVFVHRLDVGGQNLTKGQEVTFDLVEARKGLAAIRVVPGAAPPPRARAEEVSGRVKWFDAKRGYGFIGLRDGRDAFVHQREIRMEGFRRLVPGQEVRLGLEQGNKGLAAIDVVP